MTNIKPIKQDIILQPLSRDHHQTLLLVWKIRRGIKNNISVSRMANYIRWFYETYQMERIQYEEENIIPLLYDKLHEVLKVIAEHKELKTLFERKITTKEQLITLTNLLEAHVRFEERDFFSLIQETISKNQLGKIVPKEMDKMFIENTVDEFWV